VHPHVVDCAEEKAGQVERDTWGMKEGHIDATYRRIT
jgi:hypothetical protein